MKNIKIMACELAKHYKENYNYCSAEISNEIIGRVQIRYVNIQLAFTIDTYRNEVGYKLFEYPIIRLCFRGKNYYIIVKSCNHVILTDDRLNKRLIEIRRPNSELDIYKSISKAINTLVGLYEVV